MITSPSNPRVRWVHALQTRRKARAEEGLFVVEGARLAREAVAAGCPARLVLHTDTLDPRGRGLVNSLARLGAEVLTVSESALAACSSTESPPGLLAVLSQPTPPLPEQPDPAVIAAGLADPGNLGALLRSADAAGAAAVLLTEGSVDAFNPKVVRGAMGAHFRLPVVSLPAAALPERLAGVRLYAAEAGSGRPYHQVDWRPPAALIVGGEAHGPGQAVRDLAAEHVHIPMRAGVESLNAAVAAAVLLFEIARQRGLP